MHTDNCQIKQIILTFGYNQSGSFVPGSVKSSIGLGVLLLEGIGDTIRVSLSDDPIKEIKIGNEILKSLNLRSRGLKLFLVRLVQDKVLMLLKQ